MGIKSGIGIGEAQIYDTSGIVNGYYKLIQEEQKKQAKYADEFADVLSKVDFKNLDPLDYKYIDQEYQKAKSIANKYANTRNTLEQRLAINEAKKAMQDIEEYAIGARSYRKNIADIAKNMLDNPEDYDDESKDEVKKLVSLPYADAIKLNRASITPFTYKRIQDVSLVDKTIDGARKALQTMAEESGKFKKVVKDGFEQLSYSIPQESVAGLFTAEMTANPKVKFQFKELYKQMNPEAEKPTDVQLADFARSLYEKKYQQQSYNFVGDRFKADKPKKDGDGEDKLTYRQGLISGLINKDKGSLDELTAMLPANSKAEYTTSLAIPGKSKGGFGGIRVTIPAASSPTGLDIVEDIPLQAGKPIIKINSLLNQYSGEKVNPSIISIKGGKRTGEKFEVKPNRPAAESVPSATKAEWRAAGWSDAQIDEAVKSGKIKVK
jgi:hypothetical protein